MVFFSRTLSGPSPAAAPVITCIAQGKRGVLSSGYIARWVELVAGPHGSKGHACCSGFGVWRYRSDEALRGCG
jgi:hypothetical protein